MDLQVIGLSCGYGGKTVLHDIDLTIPSAGFVTVLGANNAGKSTLVNCLSGIVPAERGRIMLGGDDITALPAAARVRKGLVQIPEARQLFPAMTVRDNLLMGAIGARDRTRASTAESLENVFLMFPRLAERRAQNAGSLSGGEQQMVAMARGLMSRPAVLVLDEPSLGLAPQIVEHLFRTLETLQANGITIVLIEQNLDLSLRYADSGVVLEGGIVAVRGTAAELRSNDAARAAYLGM